jgi:hypothetical protein
MSNLFFPVLLFIFGIGLFFEGGENEAFQHHGETAQIQSVENPQVHREYKRGKHVATYYTGDLTFQTKAGDIVTVTATLPYGMLDAMKNRKVVLVQYLPEDPTTIRFDDGIKSVPPVRKKFVGILVAIVGIVCIVLTILRK